MVRTLTYLSLVMALSSCAMGPNKSVNPALKLGNFESAFVETGTTATAKSVAHIVSTDGAYGLVVYVSRTDGQPAAISRASANGAPLNYQRLQLADGQEGGMIKLTQDDLTQAAKTGWEMTLCGRDDCYQASVPAALYQQVLFE